MTVGSKLTANIKDIAMLVIVIVVFSIVLIKFKDIDGVTASLNTSIDTSVSALDEPVTWISIVVIIIVVGWLMGYLKGKKNGM